MIRRTVLLAASAALLRAGTATAQEAPTAPTAAAFTTEVGASFFYEGAKTDEPLVSIGGQPSANFFFRADSTLRALALNATHAFAPVPDDGSTPFALLTYVSRLSTASASFSLSSSGRDSNGSSRGVDVTLESAAQSDQNVRAGALSGEWYFHRSTAVRASASAVWLRSTTSTSSVELPSNRGDLNNYGIRQANASFSLGLVRRFGEHSVAAEGRYADLHATRSDHTLFGSGGFRDSDFEQGGSSWGAALSGRCLFLRRRLAADLAGSYDDLRTHFDQTAPEVHELDASKRIERRLEGAVTFHVTRALGVSAGAAYETGSEASGLSVKRPSSFSKAVALSAGVRWFATPGRSLSLLYSRTTTDTIGPPDAATFVKLVGVVSRVEAAGAIRF